MAQPQATNHGNDGVLYTIPVRKSTIIILNVFVVILSVAIGGYYTYQHIQAKQYLEMLIHNQGEETIRIFERYDRDQDGYLSIEEFEPLSQFFRDVNMSETFNYTQSIEEDDQVVTVNAHFTPLKLDSMSKNLSENSNFGDTTLPGLMEWKKPNIESLNFGVRHFRTFMPDDSSQNLLGEVYQLVHLGHSVYDSNDLLSSNRFYPPQVADANIIVHRLLEMFHQRPFIVARFRPRGAFACVRATNDKYMDIIFRIHAEFQINEPPHHPMWYTPAQFKGHLVIARDGSHIAHFNMHVPTTNLLNVDMEWLNGLSEAENMEVDIGFMPQMELNISQPSTPAFSKDGNDMRELLAPLDEKRGTTPTDIMWSQEIGEADAERSLEIKMFQFKVVPYHKFPAALNLAQTTQKLIHLILMWGALDDQSC